jgi:hypothetical protein
MPGGYTCRCTSQFTGPRCREDVDECSLNSSLCLNGGSCRNEYGSFKCDCVEGRIGEFCQFELPSQATGLQPGALAGIVIVIVVAILLIVVVIVMVIVYMAYKVRKKGRSGSYSPSRAEMEVIPFNDEIEKPERERLI